MIQLIYHSGALIGTPLAWQQEDTETTQCRKGMTWVRFKEIERKERDQQEKVTPSVPSEIAEQSIMVKLGLPLVNESMIKTIVVKPSDLASTTTKKLVEKHYKGVQNASAKRFGLRKVAIGGEVDFIEPDIPIGADDYIKECMETKAQPQLSLVEL